MLAVFRKAANSWIIKALMVILLLSFVLWGVGDSLRLGSSGYILKVGDKSYAENEFRNLYAQHVLLLQQQSGYEFSKVELNDPQLKHIVLNMIINNLVQSQLSKDMNLAVSDDMVKFEIASMSEFMRNGQFNKDIFDNYLRQSGLSESAFINLVKEELSNRTLNTMFSVLRFAPSLMVDHLAQVHSQSRLIKLITLPIAKVKVDVQPTPERLQEVYGENQARYIIPEKRDISYVVFGTEVVDNIEDPSEAELQSLYNSRIKMFSIPEQRKVRQMIFKDANQANEAYSALSKGGNFDKLAQQYFPDKHSFSLGLMTKDKISPEIGEVIFALSQHQPSEPVNSPLGYHIFIVDEIIPSKTKDFASVRSDIKAAYLYEKKFEKLHEVTRKIDKGIMNNTSLTDLAKEYGLRIITLSNISNQGEKRKDAILQNVAFLTTAFSTHEKELSMVAPLNNDNYFIVSVDKIHPQQTRPLEAVKSEVHKLWHEQEVTRIAERIADQAYKDLQNNLPLEEVSKKYPIVLGTEIEVKLFDKAPKVDATMRNDIFTTHAGRYTLPYKTQNGDYMIAFVKEIRSPAAKLQIEERKELVSELTHSLPNELVMQLLNYMRDQYKVEVNYALYNSLQF